MKSAFAIIAMAAASTATNDNLDLFSALEMAEDQRDLQGCNRDHWLACRLQGRSYFDRKDATKCPIYRNETEHLLRCARTFGCLTERQWLIARQSCMGSSCPETCDWIKDEGYYVEPYDAEAFLAGPMADCDASSFAKCAAKPGCSNIFSDKCMQQDLPCDDAFKFTRNITACATEHKCDPEGYAQKFAAEVCEASTSSCNNVQCAAFAAGSTESPTTASGGEPGKPENPSSASSLATHALTLVAVMQAMR